jgi:hypothetical protein
MEPILNQRNWEALKTKLRKRYPQLTDADLQHEEGMEDSMLRMVEYKLRKTKKEMQKIIAEIDCRL